MKENLAAKDFWDLNESHKVDREAQNKLQKLKDELHSHLPKTVFVYRALWNGKHITTDHISELCNDVYVNLSQIIKKQIDQFEDEDPLDQEIQLMTFLLKNEPSFLQEEIIY